MAYSIVVLLEQESIWRGQDGRVYYLGELDDEHLGNVIALLDRRAARLLDHRRWYDQYHSHPALGRVSELESADATSWLHDRPLYRALTAERRRRGALDGEVVSDVQRRASTPLGPVTRDAAPRHLTAGTTDD